MVVFYLTFLLQIFSQLLCLSLRDFIERVKQLLAAVTINELKSLFDIVVWAYDAFDNGQGIKNNSTNDLKSIFGCMLKNISHSSIFPNYTFA